MATGALTVRGARRARRWRESARLVVAYLLLTLGTLTMGIPFLWMVVASVQSPLSLSSWPPELLPPWPPLFSNYPKALTSQPFHLYFLNSGKIAVLALLGELLTCSLAAYAFARIRFPGREAIFLVLLATLMVPFQVTLIPVFLVMKTLGWINTHTPLWAPHWTGSAFGIFLLRQFFLTIPRELEDAAEIDGAGPLAVWWRIIMPLSGPALATLGIFTFLRSWNELLGPLIYINDIPLYTVQLGLMMFKSSTSTDVTGLMVASTVAVIPTITLFMLAQKYFVQGIVLSGLKG
jgi:ABC-type glycerol-3-phosphate transport system permease component